MISARAWLIVALIGVLTFGSWRAAEHFKEVGYGKCENDHADALAQVQQELTKLRAERASEVERFTRELDAARAAQRRRAIGEPAVADWWSVRVPDAAAAYAYGRLRPGGEGAMRPDPGKH